MNQKHCVSKDNVIGNTNLTNNNIYYKYYNNNYIMFSIIEVKNNTSSVYYHYNLKTVELCINKIKQLTSIHNTLEISNYEDLNKKPLRNGKYLLISGNHVIAFEKKSLFMTSHDESIFTILSEYHIIKSRNI